MLSLIALQDLIEFIWLTSQSVSPLLFFCLRPPPCKCHPTDHNRKKERVVTMENNPLGTERNTVGMIDMF